jgi:sarcosine oxidase gamma subunit
MFPNGAAARTLFAGVATEIVRDDQGEVPSYLLLPSRSYSTYVLDVILDAGTELGLTV